MGTGDTALAVAARCGGNRVVLKLKFPNNSNNRAVNGSVYLLKPPWKMPL